MKPRAPRIALVLFDLDGVLVEYDRVLRVRELATAMRCTPEVVQAALFEQGIEDRYDAGELDTAAYLDALAAAVGAAPGIDAWCAARAAAMHVPPHVPERVLALARRCRVGVLTNNGALIAERWPLLLPALAPLSERVLCSGLLGARKPEPAVFQRALQRLGHAPAETLFLDDNTANVEGARSAGLHAEYVRVPGGFDAILARYGLA